MSFRKFGIGIGPILGLHYYIFDNKPNFSGLNELSDKIDKYTEYHRNEIQEYYKNNPELEKLYPVRPGEVQEDINAKNDILYIRRPLVTFYVTKEEKEKMKKKWRYY